MSKHDRPIIVVRRRKSAKHSHHSGSWKIAYADFMTAMMAFFLVMWLLAFYTPLQRQQIAEYFKMPLRVAVGMGDKSSFSDSVIPGGGEDVIKQEGEVQRQNLHRLEQIKSAQNLRQARQKLESLIKTDPALSNFQSNLRLSLTEDGLLIQILDSKERPMFKIGSTLLEPYMRDILAALVPVLNELPNRISLTGHTDALPYASGERGYSNWELSADRANASRRTLVAAGLSTEKFLRVIGTADVMTLTEVEPNDPANRRISILVLSQQKEKSILKEDTQYGSITTVQDSDAAEIELKAMMPPSSTPAEGGA
ncbi:protein that enables flagellar motor rotation [Enterobacter cancerogenus]|uniref:flagellar motor protein MotB n=1 Tax=Enterobacter cancerogenus TaxID=69218 RepID=UPI001925C58D|nr:flagellar motor protein MotB [Enterobacter cancerogenus]CAD5358455.1 protein that enables flagellar motor rotation [Enterobacter cancerogenus]